MRILKSENLPEQRIFELKIENIKLWHQSDGSRSLALMDELLENDRIKNYPSLLSQLYNTKSIIYRKRIEKAKASQFGELAYK